MRYLFMISTFVLCMTPALLFAQKSDKPLTPKPSSLLVGTLMKVGEKGASAFVHQYLFRFEDGSWSGAQWGYVGEKKSDHSTSQLPREDSRHVFFDGRILQNIKIPQKTCIVPAKDLNQTTIKMLKKYPALITSSTEAKDPDGWKPIPLIKAPFKESEFLNSWNSYDGCSADKNGKKPTLKLEKIYSSKDQRRFLVIAKKSMGCSTVGDDFSDKALLFRNALGQWIVNEGQDLIDIGDFNNDGKSEGLFIAPPYPPEDNYMLKDMNSFATLVEVGSQVGGGGGPCFNQIGI